MAFCWSSVVDGGPTLIQNCSNILFAGLPLVRSPQLHAAITKRSPGVVFKFGQRHRRKINKKVELIRSVFQSWANVLNGGLTLKQRWIDVTDIPSDGIS